jgi:chaperonin GroES
MSQVGILMAGSTDSKMDFTENKETKVTKFRPLYDRVLVEVNKPKENIVNGILLPDNAVERPQEATVIAVGTGRVVNGILYPLDVKPGDKVVFGRFSGNEVEIGGKKLLILQENEIMGVYYTEE